MTALPFGPISCSCCSSSPRRVRCASCAKIPARGGVPARPLLARQGRGSSLLILGLQMVRIDLRIVVMDAEPDVISRQRHAKVNAVILLYVVDPQRAVIQVENYLAATSQLAQTTLRAVLGKHTLDEMCPSASA